MLNASSLGFTNTMTPCYVTAPILSLAQHDSPIAQPIGLGNGTECADPSSHLFWDQYAPSLSASTVSGVCSLPASTCMHGSVPSKRSHGTILGAFCCAFSSCRIQILILQEQDVSCGWSSNSYLTYYRELSLAGSGCIIKTCSVQDCCIFQ